MARATEFGHYRFVVRDHEGGFYLALEPDGRPLESLARGVLSFDLQPGLSVREVEELADQLNAIVASVAYTTNE